MNRKYILKAINTIGLLASIYLVIANLIIGLLITLAVWYVLYISIKKTQPLSLEKIQEMNNPTKTRRFIYTDMGHEKYKYNPAYKYGSIYNDRKN